MSELESASLIRPGDEWMLARLTRLGGKVVERAGVTRVGARDRRDRAHRLVCTGLMPTLAGFIC